MSTALGSVDAVRPTVVDDSCTDESAAAAITTLLPEEATSGSDVGRALLLWLSEEEDTEDEAPSPDTRRSCAFEPTEPSALPVLDEAVEVDAACGSGFFVIMIFGGTNCGAAADEADDGGEDTLGAGVELATRQLEESVIALVTVTDDLVELGNFDATLTLAVDVKNSNHHYCSPPLLGQIPPKELPLRRRERRRVLVTKTKMQ
uniref:Uncharacterized protein n=1 Tax=Anopheles merus TaxID=30066 RepID=A0A182VC34_ANOME